MAKTRKQKIEEMLAETPEDAELRYALAMEYISTGDDEGAVRCFREMFAVTPDFVPAYHQAGLALTRLNRLPEAREVLVCGIGVARKVGNPHAADEMQGFLDGLA